MRTECAWLETPESWGISPQPLPMSRAMDALLPEAVQGLPAENQSM